ncbi:cobyrinate a,c-diamide synthase [uncultured Aquimarina sp.]|uniref:cobyrinate a,c-diamide synthase n=1 Tax=uncultured Aquimarina sp. TaxID=575652 RepID=UPI002634F46F|nr:cobyrinate a,c-diamide synthase [uncultured Aquimarina sp.]
MMKPQFIIAAPTSNSGKTTITLGILRVLKNRGLSPQSFKCGPDYIDPKFHEIACEKTGVNLDLYMMKASHIKLTYASYVSSAGAVCIEGVMGLFDGAKKDEGSTAELAKLLALPIIFVVDAKSVAYSVAPLLYGFKNFDKQLNIAGVIFNRVNTKNHYQFLTEACEDVGITPLGHLPFLPDCEIPSRHLGLSIDKIASYDKVIEMVAEKMEASIDIEQLLELTTKEAPQLITSKKELQQNDYTIAVAKDEGFNFSYIQNIESLKRKGKVVYFSPINDAVLPDVDLVYLPGGYPELYTEVLSQNKTMLRSIKEHAEKQKAIIAECGGMMYLGKVIKTKEGKKYEMANVFDFETSMEAMKLNLGYRTLQYNDTVLKGHEFHYSTINNEENNLSIRTLKNAREKTVPTKLYTYKNVLASYVHFYFGTDDLLDALLGIKTQQ